MSEKTQEQRWKETVKAYEERDKEQALEETFADASMDNLDRQWEEYSEREPADDWQASPCYPYTKVPTEPFFAIYLTKRQVAKLRDDLDFDLYGTDYWKEELPEDERPFFTRNMVSYVSAHPEDKIDIHQSDIHGLIVVQVEQQTCCRCIYIPKNPEDPDDIPPWEVDEDFLYDYADYERTESAKARDAFYRDLLSAVPNWHELKCQASFLDWLGKHDPKTGTLRRKIIFDAIEDFDVASVIGVVRNFCIIQGENKMLHGRIDVRAAVPEDDPKELITALQNKILRLETELEIVRNEQNIPKLTKDDEESYGEDMIDLIRRGADEALYRHNIVRDLAVIKTEIRAIQYALGINSILFDNVEVVEKINEHFP